MSELFNTFTVPTLALLLLGLGWLALTARLQAWQALLPAFAGVLLLALSLHRHGSHAGSASPVLQLLLFLAIVTLPFASIPARREIRSRGWMALGTTLFLICWTLQLHVFPDALRARMSPPLLMLLALLSLALSAGSVSKQIAPHIALAGLVVCFGWLLLLGSGVLSGTSEPVAWRLRTFSFLLVMAGLLLTWRSLGSANWAVRWGVLAAPFTFSAQMAFKSI